MKILIMGFGAVGSSFGAFLAKDGHIITAIGREKHINAIKKSGLKVSGIWGNFIINNINCQTEIPINTKYDIILFCVKSFDTINAAKSIKHLLDKNTAILSLQNGLGNIENIIKVCNHKNVIGGRVIFGSILPKNGEVKITVYTQEVLLGYITKPNNNLKNKLEEFCDIINKSGIPCNSTTEIEKYLWAKLIYNCALNPLGAIHKVHYGALGENKELTNKMNLIIDEIFAVTNAKSIKLLWDKPDGFKDLFYSKLLPDTYNHRSSMLQDLEKGRPTEIGALNEIIVKLGEELGIRTPENKKLVEAIKKEVKSKVN